MGEGRQWVARLGYGPSIRPVQPSLPSSALYYYSTGCQDIGLTMLERRSTI